MRLPQRVCRRQDDQGIPETRHAGHRGRYPRPRRTRPEVLDAGAADTLGIMALETTRDQQLRNAIQIPIPADGQLKYIVPAEAPPRMSRITTGAGLRAAHLHQLADAASNREDGTRAKDGLYSLIDYLDPNATRAFINVTHETYRQAVGDEFGNTVLGFFGDEPDYSINGTPWTPNLLEEFQKQKGYDLKPYIPQFFSGKLTDEAQRAKADYWDVWSGIFRNSFSENRPSGARSTTWNTWCT